MAWPRKISHGGEGDGRMDMKERNKDFARDSKRRFMRDAVLVMLGRLDLSTETSEGYLQAIVEIAEDLHNRIEKKL